MLRFEPIDLAEHGQDAFRIRVDSFVIGFGTADAFIRDSGESGDRYLELLRERMKLWPMSCVHAWRGNLIVGQIELSLPPMNPDEGYVNLYYLVPEERSSGIGASLDEYAIEWFKNAGLSKAALSVSKSNDPALKFYSKMGWRLSGAQPKDPRMINLRRDFERTPAV